MKHINIIISILIILIFIKLIINYYYCNKTKKDIGYNYVLQSYKLKYINSFTGNNLFNEYLNSIYPQLKNKIEILNKDIINKIGKNQTVWGFQFNLINNNIGIEYYFYKYASWSNNKTYNDYWNNIDKIFKNNYNFDVKKPKIDFTPGLISVDIPTINDNIQKVDVYNMTTDKGNYCLEANNKNITFKNSYKFFTNNKNINTYMKKNEFPKESLLLNDWKFSICFAKKSNGNKCIYYSGITVDDLLLFSKKIKKNNKMIKKFIKPIEKNYDLIKNFLFDVGYDFTYNKKLSINKICIYSWF